MVRARGVSSALILLIALSSCGQEYINPINSKASELCGGIADDSFDPILNNSLTNMRYDFCGVKSASDSGQKKLILNGDYVQANSGLEIVAPQGIEPRDNSIPIVLKQAQVPSTDNGLNFQGEELSQQQLSLLKPLIDDIMTDYGNPQTDVGKIRALRDWVARTIIHPYSFFHIFSPNKNTINLPEGKNWNDFYAYANNQKIYDDFLYLWGNYKLDGFKLLDYAIDLSGGNTGGLMRKVSGSHYRMRDIENTTYYQCTPQAMILITLANAMGYQGVLISTVGHDTSAIYVPSLSKWIYEDATYNEDYIDSRTGAILSPDELLEKSFEGVVFSDATAVKNPGPSWDPSTFLDFVDSLSTTYFNEHPVGMAAMGSQLNGNMIDNPLYDIKLNQIMTPLLPSIYPFNDERVYRRVLPQRAFPELGLYAGGFSKRDDGVYDIVIKSNTPTANLEISRNHSDWVSAPEWESGGTVSLPSDGGLVYLRAETPGGLKTSEMIIKMPQ